MAKETAIPRLKTVLQFRVELLDISPTIWRRIVVPSAYSFWDLHVAIQDSMGWLDYHLHEFLAVEGLDDSSVRLGIPDQDDEDEVLPDWEFLIEPYFLDPGDTALYIYDFGDDWRHKLLLEGIFLAEQAIEYPICLAGERACPPEDCGSISGYVRLIEILKNRSHGEFADMQSWLKGHAKNYWPYDPDTFVPQSVRFDNPHIRWKKAFEPDWP